MSLCDPACTADDATPASRELLAQVVEQFYARVRRDPLLGEVFETAVHDWPTHLTRITRFWGAVLSGEGTFHGRPVQAHAPHAAAMTPARFERWLALWGETTSALCPPALATSLQAKAAQIGASLQHAIEPLRARASRVRLPVVEAVPPLPVPYRSTPIFDEHSLPRALRHAHQTKAGVWGVIRVLAGRVRLHVDGEAVPRELDPEHPGVVLPTQRHHVEPVGAVRLQVDFYDVAPTI